MKTRSGKAYKEIVKTQKKKEKKAAQFGARPEPKRFVSAREIKQNKRTDDLIRTLNEALQQPLLSFDEDSSTFDESSTGTLVEIPIQNRTSRKTSKMSDHLTKVAKLSFEGNVSENWKRFKRNFGIFLIAGELQAKTDNIKIHLLLNAIGEEAVKIFDSFPLTQAQRGVYDDVIKAFDDFCLPKKNPVYERWLLDERKQREGEPFDAFLADIRRLISTCDYIQPDEILRDRIVFSVYDKKLMRKLLETPNLTYDIAVEKCRAYEATAKQFYVMNKTVAVNEIQRSKNVDTIKYAKHSKGSMNNKHHANNSNTNKRNEKERRGQQQQQRQSNDTRYRNNSHNGNSSSMNNNNRDKSDRFFSCCKYCGLSHKIRECPAYGKTCTTCLKNNHFSTVCKSKNVAAISIHNNDYSDSDELFVSSIEQIFAVEDDDDENEVSYPWIEKIWIEGKLVAFKIDTGAQINVLPLSVYNRLETEIILHRTNTKLRAFNGQKVAPVGMCSLFGKFESVSCKMKTAVVDIDVMPILGLQTAIDLGFVSPSAQSRVIKSCTFTNSTFKRDF